MIATAHYYIGSPASTPSILPSPGPHVTDVVVRISDTTAGAAIYYTINGTTPTPASKKYRAPFKLTESATVKAIAIGSDGVPSKMASAAYTVKTAEPAFSPNGGALKKTQKVTITDATPGAAIYFTTNGTTPTAHSRKYVIPLTVGANETIKAIAIVTGQTQSVEASATFTVK